MQDLLIHLLSCLDGIVQVGTLPSTPDDLQIRESVYLLGLVPILSFQTHRAQPFFIVALHVEVLPGKFVALFLVPVPLMFVDEKKRFEIFMRLEPAKV